MSDISEAEFDAIQAETNELTSLIAQTIDGRSLSPHTLPAVATCILMHHIRLSGFQEHESLGFMRGLTQDVLVNAHRQQEH